MATPLRRVVTATYDDRGHLTATTDSATYSDAGGLRRYATTRYEWDLAWDMVTKTIQPLGEVVQMAYDPQTGNRLWQQPSVEAQRRAAFFYTNPVKLLSAMAYPAVSGNPAARDSVEYDTTTWNVAATALPSATHCLGLLPAAGARRALDNRLTNPGVTP